MSTARKALVVTVVAVGVVVCALALWKLRVLIALLFLALTVSAAIRPGVEWLHVRGVPRQAGVLLHYLALGALLGLLLWLIVPQAISQVQYGLDGGSAHSALQHAAAHTRGIEHDLLVGLDRRLRRLPNGAALIHPALTVTRRALEVLVGIFFTFAVAAYWIFEREWAERLVLSLVPYRRRDTVLHTWRLIDQKLGAFVRGQLLLMGMVSSVLAVAFWAIALPYWLLLAVFAGIVEMVPVVGPLIGGGAAVAVGLTQSWHVALLAAVAVYGLRLLQDYVVNPRVLGRAVGLSPLIVLVTVSVIGLLLGPFYVILSVPLAAVLATVIDVVVLGRDPSRERVPTVLFAAKEREVS